MKKVLICLLAFVLMTASLAVAASAAASDWVKGNGAHIYKSADPSTPKVTAGRVQVESNSPVTVSDAGGNYGVYVSHKGYYENGDNWSGVVSKQKFGLDGLEVTVKFDEVPVVDASDDCWFALDLVRDCAPFFVRGDYNPGFINLIRFGQPGIETFGATAWGNQRRQSFNSPEFAVVSGDTLKLNVRYELGQYIMTFTHNDTAVWEVPAELTLEASDEVFTDGTAYVLVTGSCFGVDKVFSYTVNVNTGVELTQEQVADKARDKEIANFKASIEGCALDVEYTWEDAVDLVGTSHDDKDVQAWLDEIFEARNVVYACEDVILDVETVEEAQDVLSTALNYKNYAYDAYNALEQYVEDFGIQKNYYGYEPETYGPSYYENIVKGEVNNVGEKHYNRVAESIEAIEEFEFMALSVADYDDDYVDYYFDIIYDCLYIAEDALDDVENAETVYDAQYASSVALSAEKEAFEAYMEIAKYVNGQQEESEYYGETAVESSSHFRVDEDSGFAAFSGVIIAFILAAFV